jgi:hypothetical protein
MIVTVANLFNDKQEKSSRPISSCSSSTPPAVAALWQMDAAAITASTARRKQKQISGNSRK